MRASIVGCALGFVACGAENPPETSTCRERAANPYHAEVVGTGLADQDGNVVHVLTDVSLAGTSDVCRTTEITTIVAGQFQVTLTNLTDTAVYPFVGAFIDRDGDGDCGSADLIWGTDAIILGDQVKIGGVTPIAIGPTSFMSGDAHGTCAHFRL